MKFIFRLIVLLGIVFFALPPASCRREPAHYRGEALPVDSLFEDLGKADRERRAAMAEAAFTTMHRTLGLNGAVLYAEGGQVLYEQAFGWRDLKRRQIPLHTSDTFQLASVSKMFTAEAIMLLHAQGKLSYDDDLQRYLPEFPYRGITLRHLLNHRSGLSRYESLADEHWPDRGVPLHNDDMVQLFQKHRPDPYFEPDADFHYNNVNYALLANVVERVSGQHFEDFMKENVFEPLGMHHSYIYSLRGVGRLGLYTDTGVQGYDLYRSGPQRVQEDYLNGVVGDKVMYSTVEDLYRFSVALETHQLLPDSIQREAFLPGSETWKHGDNYGFGWRMSQRHPGIVYHFGWWKGYRSFFIIDRPHERVLIILTNTSSSAPGDPAWDFISDTTLQLPAACALPTRPSVFDH